ncbi:type II toxin-antitoxin system RelE/ParE family toxin [Rhizobium sp. CB3090]|uniref:type II toxin-antitoxin system RelE/ParE family toxin n=1 Tax=Rhizobium sp. CB3090 TaxID=3039156 RepID=UPI0024B0B991|nr:type II toxin-antitoxin system RelE/ParE family toxin [Rhizobium sp. CB3090]WFU09771.1 type II toxin-antitoxin system RelE/ParE family toxin [Rhizobium sp. CB3090]
MNYRVVFSAFAEDDLIGIYEFIAKDSPGRALSFVQRLGVQCRTLETMAARGPQRESLGPGVRIMIFERRVTVAYHIKNEQGHCSAFLLCGPKYPVDLDRRALNSHGPLIPINSNNHLISLSSVGHNSLKKVSQPCLVSSN